MLFHNLMQVLRPLERLRFTVYREGEELTVLLEPLLTSEPATNLAPEIQQARAYLATPLHLQGSAASLDADFEKRLSGYADAIAPLAAETQTLKQRLAEATKETRAKSVAASARTSKTETARDSTPPPKTTSSATPASSEAPAKDTAPAEATAAKGEMKPASLF